MKKIFLVIFSVMFFFSSIAHAEIKIYTGEGIFAVENETLAYARNKAKIDAERNISEQISVYIQSDSEVKNSQLTHDEIILMTRNLMRILNVKYKVEPAENSFLVRAIVIAEIDTDDIKNFFNNHEEKKNE